MDQKKDCSSKQEARLEDGASQDALDSSSASSLSFLVDQNSGYLLENEKFTSDGPRSGECSPRVPMDEALKSEKAFIEFVMSLPPRDASAPRHHTSADSVTPRAKTAPPATGGNTTTTTAATKVGLDHLDNLCKLMEQLSELRDTNNKLQRRVQYLEDLKTLHDMHKEINDEAQYSSEDALAEHRPPYELKKSATETTCCPVRNDELHVATPTIRSQNRYHGRRGRAHGTEGGGGQRRERSKSVGHEEAGCEDTKSKRIFPKWSKVKEALGWESDRKDSVKGKVDGDAGSVRPPPRRCSDDSHQTSYHHHPPKSPSWSQDYPSLHSSLEDIHEILDTGRWKRSSVVSEKHLETPKEALRRLKSTPSPGSEKLTPHRDVSGLKPKSSTIERDTYSQQEYSKFDKEDGKRGKSPWGRVKTIIERRRDSLKRRSLRQHDCDPPKVAEVKSYAEYVESSARQAVVSDSRQHRNNFEAIVIDEEDYPGPRTPSSSPTFHRKSRWTRVKKALKGKKEDDRDPSLSTPASPNSGQDGHFTFDAVEEIGPYDACREIKRVGSDSHLHQLSAGPTCDLVLQLQRNLSEDFHRKIAEWERIRSSGNASCSPRWEHRPGSGSRRKKSERDGEPPGNKGVPSKPPKLKDLTWLEKELQKIEKEKQRLSKEKQKYEERALRLERLRETVLNNADNKREVFVRTSAGEFRFEGISDAFTKKLYEWETKRGLGPELSTIALLDSSRLTVVQSGPLQRVVSRSESSIADIGQPSHNSSNSLPSVKVPESGDAVQPSRANSEPDLSTLVVLTAGGNGSVTNLSRRVGDSPDDDLTTPTSPGASRGSEEEEEEDPDSGKKEDSARRNDSETYYGLLEENVILLEQLKDKEDICRRLEKELELLDKKVDVMNDHHTQETERYREKLWEMHKPGATPRDVQCCLLTMSRLKKRIDALEKCTEKLRNDRESVEDSFRYHTKQQEDMTLDLLQKMSELQAAGSSTTEWDDQGRVPPRMDASVLERLQDLSALLVKQTQELQETLTAKTRQICQLRWELLHRDLSTVKLETELHTHTAHRKRSKYAHFRSHSSEEAPTIPLPQELESGKSVLVTEAYYGVHPESDFRATELTNTVQQLNREVLRLASATEYPHGGDCSFPQVCQEKTNNEKSWAKINSQSRNKDKTKQITVRRSSADNLGSMSAKDNDRWKQNSSDSDNSSDDCYTQISFRPRGGHRNFFNPNAEERLLMSSGEHPPHLQRRKKLQKSSRGGNPSRKRSNTFHNKRDFEKPCENVPQKYHSFRLPAEKNLDCPRGTVNIQNLLGDVRYREFLQKRLTHVDCNGSGRMDNSSAEESRVDGQWLRGVASDSKIPLLFQLQCRTDERGHSNKCPVRSLSDKHGKETAAERRENYQRKKNRNVLTSPDVFSNLSESLKARILAASSHPLPQKKEGESGYGFSSNTSLKKLQCPQIDVNIPLSNSDSAANVTIQLPRRKSRKTSQSNAPRGSSEKLEDAVTVVVSKKRSLSSEMECEGSCLRSSSGSKSPERTAENQKTAHSFTDSDLYRDDHSPGTQKVALKIRESAESQLRATNLIENRAKSDISSPVPSFANDGPQNEQTSRKRKAEDFDAKLETESLTMNRADDNVSNQDVLPSNIQSTHTPKLSVPRYEKSPSAPHLDWRKVCAKKVTREGAPNVRSLIEKYNRVAEGHATRSVNSSALSSPACSRKISAPVYHSGSDCNIPSYSFSTPTTPSIIPASAFYNPLVFRPVNLDLFARSPPESPLSASRAEAIKRAKEQFIASQNMSTDFIGDRAKSDVSSPVPSKTDDDKKSKTVHETLKRTDADRMSNCSMDSASLVMFRSGETCQESRLSKRSVDYSRQESDTLDRRHNLKTSKSLSNSSIFKSVLSSDFKMPSTLLKLKRSKRKKDMATVSQLCRQSLLLATDDDDAKMPSSQPPPHKSCPSSPELKNKSEVKHGWFHRNIFRHK